MIKIQKEDFDLEKEINFIKSKHKDVGAISTFIGYVRNTNNNKKVTSIDLEVYKKMAIKSLKQISDNAKTKWRLKDSLIIHRFGKLYINQKIVLVATFSNHRKDSFESCKYIMNFLKKDAPFWKKEFYEKNYKWL
tara:strand:+ start:568 stop:972 length:405 start_codon:yes stop_codon:yes gene_type:complete